MAQSVKRMTFFLMSFLPRFLSALCPLLSALCSLSLNHLVRPRQHVRRNREPDLLSRLEVDDEFELRRLLHGEIGGLCAFQDLVNVNSCASPQIGEVCSIRHKAASLHPKTLRMHRWKPLLCREFHYSCSVSKH